VIREVLPEVDVTHHHVKEGKWVTRRRIDADIRDDVMVRRLGGCPGPLEEFNAGLGGVEFWGRVKLKSSRRQVDVVTTLAIPPGSIPKGTKNPDIV